jgi:hypothetical protein
MRPIEKISYFYEGTLLERAERNELLTTTGAYTQLLYNTHDKLIKMGIEEPLNYEMHIPMIMNKKKFKEVLKHKTCLWRSLYGNIYEVGGTDREDVKVYVNSNLNPKSYNISNLKYPYLSSEDKSFMTVYKAVLKNMFKSKSPYEA